MKQLVEMPGVNKCEAKECAYNLNQKCHARGITVGDAQQRHLCDTMWQDKGHTRRAESAGVGACRQTSCKHNDDLECQADGINVKVVGTQAQCGTFTVR